jgi:predicted alpha/beta hydrolase
LWRSFLPPAHKVKQDKVIILCDGMPGMPTKQGLARFLSEKGYWVIYPRYRGSWESGGQFLKKSPHLDISDIIDELPKGLKENTFGKKFKLSPSEIFVIGGSFGGAAAALKRSGPKSQKGHRQLPGGGLVRSCVIPRKKKPRIRAIRPISKRRLARDIA